ncbi:MAG TPA: hypothetical protein VGJ37_04965 [Pyrinomonadaceae bacterium]|jgi:hypothetical protein
MSDLFYAVIALKTNEVPAVVQQLDALKLDGVAAWLDQNHATFYGNRNEDWKPFNGQTISQLVNQTKGYQTQTNLIDQLKNDISNVGIVRPIRVYFIDVFALFVDKYIKFAGTVDFSVAESGQCCLLIPSALPFHMQDLLIGVYCKVWREVCNTYRQGNLHRIAMRVDDLQNFRNYLLKLFGSDDSPSIVAEQELSNRFPFQTKQPPSFARN